VFDAPRGRTLVLLRHAKAVTAAHTDHERELADRGHADAAAVGAWLVEHGLHFDVVLCSTATRTRETWADVVAAGVDGKRVSYESAVYDATTQELLDLIAEVPDSARSVLVVGHSPGIPALAAELAGTDGSDPAALASLRDGFPTSALAVLEVPVLWAELAPGACRLQAVAAPRG
jgi:phosphohistidine phosphatase